MRPDIKTAISGLSSSAQRTLAAEASACLAFLGEHLPQDERIHALCPAAVRTDLALNSVLALTDRRVLFVAPLPQVLSWPLAQLDDFSSFDLKARAVGLSVTANGRDYSLGIGRGYGDVFVRLVVQATAVARLRTL
ncbi:hypothetical protein AB0O28_01190 [Microbispora sp. NPDC088329]|uniref:hypothetical protein n=1 Tax=Microbispora sp. NPDC088329 TaxID=3154869 RepID=UPI00341409D0